MLLLITQYQSYTDHITRNQERILDFKNQRLDIQVVHLQEKASDTQGKVSRGRLSW